MQYQSDQISDYLSKQLQNNESTLRSREGMGSQGQKIIKSKRNSSQQQKINDPFLQTAFLIHETIKMSNYQQNSNLSLQPLGTEPSVSHTQRNSHRNHTSSEETHSISSGRQTPDFRSTLSRNQIYRKPSIFQGQTTSNLPHESPIKPYQLYNNTHQNFNGSLFSPQSTSQFGSLNGSELQPKKLFSPQENKQQIPNIFGGQGDSKFPKLKPINVSKKISRQQMLRKLQKELSQSELQTSQALSINQEQQQPHYQLYQQQQQYNTNQIKDQSDQMLLVNPFSGQSQRSNHQQNKNQYKQQQQYEAYDDTYQEKQKKQSYQQNLTAEYTKIFQKQKPLQLQDWTSNQTSDYNEPQNLQVNNSNNNNNNIRAAQSFRSQVRSPTLSIEPLQRDMSDTMRQKSGSALNISMQQNNNEKNAHSSNNQQNSLSLAKSKQLSKSQSQARISQHQVFQDRYGVKDQTENVYNYNEHQEQEQQQQQQNYIKSAKNESKIKLQSILQLNSGTFNHIKRRNQVSILDQISQENTGYNTTRTNYEEPQNQNKQKNILNGSQSARILQNIISGNNKNYINQIQLPKIDQNNNKSRNSIFMYNTQQQQVSNDNQSTLNSKTQLKLNQILKKQDELLKLQQKLMTKDSSRQQSPQPERDDKTQNITYINNFRSKYLTKQQINLNQNINLTVLDQQQQQYEDSNNNEEQIELNQVAGQKNNSNNNVDVRKGIQSLMIKQFDKLQSSKQNNTTQQQKQSQSPSSKRYEEVKPQKRVVEEQIKDLNFQPQQQQKQQNQQQSNKKQKQNNDYIEEQESQYEDSQDEVAFIDDKQNKLDAKNLELFNQSSRSNKRLIEKSESQTIDIEKLSKNQPVSSQLMILQQIQQSSYNPQQINYNNTQPQPTQRQQPKQKKQIQLSKKQVSINQRQPSPIKNQNNSQKPIEFDEAYSQIPIAQPLYKVMSSQVIRNAIIHEDDAESVLSSRLASRQ